MVKSDQTRVIVIVTITCQEELGIRTFPQGALDKADKFLLMSSNLLKRYELHVLEQDWEDVLLL